MTIPDATKGRVVDKWLEDVPNKQIAREEGISDSSVDNIINEYQDSIGPREKVRRICKVIKRSKLSDRELAIVARLVPILVRHVHDSGKTLTIAGVKRAVSLVKEYLNTCDSNLRDPEKVLQMTRIIENLCDELGVPPQELVQTMELLIKEIGQLKSQVCALRTEREECLKSAQEARESRDIELRLYGVTQENVDHYAFAREEAAKDGIELDDYARSLLQFMHEVRSRGVSLPYALRKVKRLEDMEAEHEKWKVDRMKQFEVARHADAQEMMLTASMLKERRILELMRANGLSDDQCLRLMATMMHLSKKNGKPAKDYFEEILVALETVAKEPEMASGAGSLAPSPTPASPRASVIPEKTSPVPIPEPESHASVKSLGAALMVKQSGSILEPEPTYHLRVSAVTTSGL